ncbi:MAG TPA: F0F1 ATP synthase subunit B [Actinomycetota bacterium]|jgi:F-type H+-transporting ATPase subunit b|nr:F0F1 ATP synthase subunit B [Actinomycetota bacterium]
MTTGSVTALLLAQEGEHEREGIDLVLPETAELVWGIICFAIVTYVLMRIAFPRIREAIEAREQKIQGDLENAENAKTEAQSQLEDYKKQLAEARSEANRIIEEARSSAEEVRKDIIARSEKEAEGIVARAQEQIQAERQRTVQELQRQIADLSIELAEKVVGRSLDGGSQRDLVDAYIREVAGMSSNGGTSN